MAIGVKIEHGPVTYLSPSVIPSRDLVLATGANPTLEATVDTGENVVVYVKVENTGTTAADDLGCGCAAPTPAAWTQPTFTMTGLPGAGPASPVVHAGPLPGYSFTANSSRDFLTINGLRKDVGEVTPTHRIWGWSPDNRFFAYVFRETGAIAASWKVTIISLLSPSLSTVVSQTGTFGGAWSAANFGWAGAKGVLYAENPDGTSRGLALPDVPTSFLEPVSTGPWTCVTSPCGARVAFVPDQAGSGVTFRSTATGGTVTAKRNNVSVPITAPGGAGVGITTLRHNANGVQVDGSTEFFDDPDCTAVGFGVVARVDRVPASSLPNATIGVLAVGELAVGFLAHGASKWVQVINTDTNHWYNFGGTHWCLLAQAYTNDQDFPIPTIDRPWNGPADGPFPRTAVNCGQHNFDTTVTT